MSGLPQCARRLPDDSRTAPDSVWVRDTIYSAVQRECARCFGTMTALISTGSLARGEASVIRSETSHTILGDAEFMVVFEKNATLPPADVLAEVGRRIETDLRQHRIECKIDLSAVHPVYFQRLPAHIFTYELKHRGRVIQGDAALLQSIPDHSAAELSKEDAWRLLCNRLIEVLGSTEGVAGDGEVFSPKLQYKLVKLYLDMATSLLVFAGSYAPSYRERREEIARLAEQGETGGFPFDLQEFSPIVAACSAEKLAPAYETGRLDLSWRSAMHTAHGLWRWELAILVGKAAAGNDRALFDHWLRAQSFKTRMRGWLYVLRACGWQRSYRLWPRWWHLRKASPRHWVYLVASSLLFAAQHDVTSPQAAAAEGNLNSLSQYLPVQKATAKRSGNVSWNDLAHDVVWNYREFLTGTRA